MILAAFAIALAGFTSATLLWSLWILLAPAHWTLDGVFLVFALLLLTMPWLGAWLARRRGPE